jgi:DNA-binding MarR family transcriptional regulator
MTKAQNIHSIHEQFKAIVKLAEKLEKSPRRFGTQETLTSSEIHLVELVGDNNESICVTDLAGLLGVTKGAVSQNLKRLENKGFTTKHEDPENSSRSIVKLTLKGKTAYYAHKHWHETMDGGFKTYFQDLSQDKVDFLIEFMKRTEDFLRRTME